MIAAPPFGLQVALGPGDDRLDVQAGVARGARRGRQRARRVTGGDGADLLTGGAGEDTLTGGLGADGLEGGAGQDTVSYRERTAGVAASIGSPTPDDGEAGETRRRRGRRRGRARRLGRRPARRLAARRPPRRRQGQRRAARPRRQRRALRRRRWPRPPPGPASPARATTCSRAGPAPTPARRRRRRHRHLRRAGERRPRRPRRPAGPGRRGGENDQLDDVENVWGGLGRDTLLGDGRANLLWGGPGATSSPAAAARTCWSAAPAATRCAATPATTSSRRATAPATCSSAAAGRIATRPTTGRPGRPMAPARRQGRDRRPLRDPGVDAANADCETRDVLAGGGVGGAPAGSPLNPKAVVDVALPYALVTVLRAVARRRRHGAAAADVLRPRGRPLRGHGGAASGGRGGRRGEVVVPAGRDGTFPVPLDAADPRRVAAAPVRVVATLTVQDALGREAASRFALTLRSADGRRQTGRPSSSAAIAGRALRHRQLALDVDRLAQVAAALGADRDRRSSRGRRRPRGRRRRAARRARRSLFATHGSLSRPWNWA